MRSGETVLQGRHTECQEIEGFVDDIVALLGASLMIAGETGMGKTALLRYAARRAGTMPDRIRVLAAKGVRAESALPFAGLHGLLGPVLGFLPRIPPRQAAALSAGLALSAGSSDDAFAIAAGTLNLLTAAAAERPLLVLVDDVDMWDATSRQALLFVARRVATEGVGVVLSTTDDEVDQCESGVRCLRVGALDTDASLALLAQASPTPIAQGVAQHLVTVAAGVPLALTELPYALTPAQLAGAAPVPDPPPMGDRVRRAVAPRLAGLGAGERAALVVAAAAGQAGIGPTRDALAALGIPETALEAAEAGGVVRLDGAGVSFTHPLVRAVVYHEATVAQRRAVHRALADVTPPVTRAWHLGTAVLGPDEETAQELERTAWECCGDLPAGGAARLMERAAELTGPGPLRAHRYLSATELWQLAGEPGPAGELLDRAVRLTDDVRIRAYAQAMHARVDSLRGRPAQAHRCLLREAARIRGADPAGAAVMLLDAVDAACLDGEAHAALVAVRRARLVAVGAPAELQAVCAAQHAAVLARAGLLANARDVLGDCGVELDKAASSRDVPVGWRRVLWVGLPSLLVRLGELDAARRGLDEAVVRSRALAAFGLLPALLCTRAEVDMRTGDWDGAYASATEAVRLAEQVEQPADAAQGLVVLARLAAARGSRPECRTYLERVREIVGRCQFGGLSVPVDAAEGLLELGDGDPEAAFVRLERVVRQVEASGCPDPGWVSWLPDYVEAAIHVGQADVARRVLIVTAGQTAGSLLLPAVVARCWALLAAASDAADGEELFAAALNRDHGCHEPFEHARTELSYGEWLRAQGRLADASLPLRAAATTFDELGARSWAERARRGLAGDAAEPAVPLGLVTSRSDDRLRCLTAQEHRVAMLVGHGATNREAATTLFVSPKTIEFHLRSVYRKLDVRSRAELAHLIGAGHRTTSAA